MNLNTDKSENVNYDYESYPIYIRKCNLSAYPDYSAVSHWHDDIEFIAILSGSMEYNVNGKIISINKNEAIAINSRQFHFGFSSKKTECEFICVLLHPKLLSSLNSYKQDFVLPLLNNCENDFWLLKNTSNWQKDIIASILKIYDYKNDKTAPLKIQSEFLKIWALFYENTRYKSVTQNSNEDDLIIKNMVSYIHENFTQKITLNDIANAGAVGQSKCCKLFLKYTAKTPISYLTQYRLDKSIFYLTSTSNNITKISAAVGFNSSSYYAEAFRKRYGMSPTEYRKVS